MWVKKHAHCSSRQAKCYFKMTMISRLIRRNKIKLKKKDFIMFYYMTVPFWVVKPIATVFCTSTIFCWWWVSLLCWQTRLFRSYNLCQIRAIWFVNSGRTLDCKIEARYTTQSSHLEIPVSPNLFLMSQSVENLDFNVFGIYVYSIVAQWFYHISTPCKQRLIKFCINVLKSSQFCLFWLGNKRAQLAGESKIKNRACACVGTGQCPCNVFVGFTLHGYEWIPGSYKLVEESLDGRYHFVL